MSGALTLALTPVPLLLGLGVAGLAGKRAPRWAQVAALAALVATLALLGADAAAVAAGGRILASLGEAMHGVPYLFRADGIGVTLAVTATVAALLALLGGRVVQPGAAASLLLCALGSVVAALAGNAVMLFGGVELANVGTFLLLTQPGRRPGRGVIGAVALEHFAALGLLAAAADLEATVGTADFGALPGGAVTAAVAAPWGIGAAVRLLAPAVLPLRQTVATAAWAATAAVPTGAVMLLRLREAAGGVQPLAGSVTLGIMGAGIAGAGTALLVSNRRSSQRAGRGLCLAVAGPVIALSAMPQAIAATAVAAGVAALEIAAAASCLWERSGPTVQERGLAAAALVAASGLPLGFGTTAVVLELSAALGMGPAGLPLLLALGLAAAVTAAATVRVAATVFRTPGAPARGRGVPSAGGRMPAPLGVFAFAAALAGAVVPGAFAGWLNGALGAPGTLGDAGAAAVTGPAGGWSGGYFVVASIVVGAAWLAGLSLSGVRLTAPTSAVATPDHVPAARLPVPLRQIRRLRRPQQALGRAVPLIDSWAAQQPQLPLIAAGGLLAVLLIR